jgi:3'-phosphoadenosine 5'-phosphosulfate sulfotransferase (PAPS reductase)/FAD synthetase
VSDQLSILPKLDPDDLVAEAKAKHQPIATFCLFSGGGDSLVTAHRCRSEYDELVFIDTGTAVPGVREFVEEAAAWLGKPLRVLGQDFDAYRLLVLGGIDWKGREWHVLGFPGPAQHGRAYNRLKERPLEQLLAATKAGHPRSARVMALTGIRRAESARRAKREPINRKGSMVFVNPLIDWTGYDMRRYRIEHELPESPVAALLHRSGECNCGSFADEGEREMLRSLWPEWFESRIGAIEREAERLGLPCAKWGGARDQAPADAGPLCSSCEWRQMRLEDVA